MVLGLKAESVALAYFAVIRAIKGKMFYRIETRSGCLVLSKTFNEKS
jgi:hypothetical protein